MTSPRPLLYNTCYHIYNRGANRGNIFFEARNYAYFLKLYEKHIAPVADTFAYCLLKNHFHLALRVKLEEEIREKILKVSSPNVYKAGQGLTANREADELEKPLGPRYVSSQFSNFFNAYAKTINKTYHRTGSLFQHPFGRVLIKTNRQFWNVIRYIHQNPQKHRFVGDFREWQHSSYGFMLASQPTFLKRDILLEWFGGNEAYLERHSEWVGDAQSKWFAEDDFD